ncbi:DUF885 domain-containing protein [Ferrimicrobium sp.]|jgi:uncharacterized protein (DUF885 family)|uniref:DUF885 domain-containing protein n=2 Tax=Ferrimicrobium sp. TaxID=2926050 RepID=UPI002633CE0E|nr:DUF885 domain-containing protein [Ferrimicrobium sp.]MCL5972856.1 DUF885 domain-containing protein [Actinomycetota bacterium]
MTGITISSTLRSILVKEMLMTPSINELAANYLNKLVKLDPILATELGTPDDPAALPDFSPEGQHARAELHRSTLATANVTEASEAEQIGKELMIERLTTQLSLYEAEEWLSEINVIDSPQHQIKQAIDLMPRETDEDWESVTARLTRVRGALEGYQQTLQLGLARGRIAPQRQALQAARLARQTATPGGPSYFDELLTSRRRQRPESVARLEAACHEAATAYLDFANFLELEYLPKTPEVDGVGSDRWRLYCQLFNGATFDPRESYLWGFDELAHIRREMESEADKILPGAGLAATITHLDTDPSRVIHGADAFRLWNQQILQETVAALNGTHFDIPDAIMRIEAMLAPPGGAAAMYYTPPSADLSRPGRTWYPTQGRTEFPLWHELSTVFHEGVPGHHLQIGYTTWLGDRLNAFQRTLGGNSGHIEGWALYAEALMDELGFFEESAYRLGMLASQAFRAARVVIDIGLHNGLAVPRDLLPEAPERWTRESSIPFLQAMAGLDRDFATSEVDRYLGWPAQATSYKLGQRAWLDIRDRLRRQEGPSFDLKRFHHRALELGFVGLDQLARVLVGSPTPPR